MVDALTKVVEMLKQVGLELWDKVVNAVPGLIAAIIVLLVGYILGRIIGYVARKIIEKAKVMKFLKQKVSIQKVLGNMDVPHVTEAIIKWYVFVLFLPAAAELVKIMSLQKFLFELALWIPNLIAAIVIAFAGIIIGVYVAEIVRKTKARGAEAVAQVANGLIVLLTLITALDQVGVKTDIIKQSFAIILIGIMLAFGLAFGLGGQRDAAEIIKKTRAHL